MDEFDEFEEKCRARVGETLNRKWHLDELLGVGGMAAVYSATHRNGARSAIKLLHRKMALDAEMRERFLREAYIANKVKHSGSVQIFDDDIDQNDLPYIVMELLEGTPLDVVAEERPEPMSTDEVLRIVDSVLATLEVAHAVGIVHRDIKPENIFLTFDGGVKVLDFGIARLRDSSSKKLTQTGHVFGTPAFMPPEQALGRHSQIDARTDLWAVGAIAFYLLSGQHVHEGENINEIMVSAATRPPRSLSRVVSSAPLELVRFVDKALQFESTKRYLSATEMRAALASFWQAPAPAASASPMPSSPFAADTSSAAAASPAPGSPVAESAPGTFRPEPSAPDAEAPQPWQPAEDRAPTDQEPAADAGPAKSRPRPRRRRKRPRSERPGEAGRAAGSPAGSEEPAGARASSPEPPPVSGDAPSSPLPRRGRPAAAAPEPAEPARRLRRKGRVSHEDDLAERESAVPLAMTSPFAQLHEPDGEAAEGSPSRQSTPPTAEGPPQRGEAVRASKRPAVPLAMASPFAALAETEDEAPAAAPQPSGAGATAPPLAEPAAARACDEPAPTVPPQPVEEPALSHDAVAEDAGAGDGVLLADWVEVTAEQVEDLRELFSLFERSLVSHRQYGGTHPVAQGHVARLEKQLYAALERSDGTILWGVAPFGFTAGGHSLWEPDPPLDHIPYQLFADGIRTFSILAGVTPTEFRRLLAILSMDRLRDMPPEDDFVTLLWAAGLDNVQFEAVDSFSEGFLAQRASVEKSRDEIFCEAKSRSAADLERCWREGRGLGGGGLGGGGLGGGGLAGAGVGTGALQMLASGQKVDVEAAIQALSFSDGETDEAEAHEALAAAARVDQSMRAMLAARLDAPSGQIAARFAVAAAIAYSAYSRGGREDAVARALEVAVDRMAERSPSAAAELVRNLLLGLEGSGSPAEVARLRSRLAGEIVSPVLIVALGRYLGGDGGEAESHPPDEASDEGSKAVALAAIRQAMGVVGPERLQVISKALVQLDEGPVLDLVLDYLRRSAAGQEGQLGAMLPQVGLQEAMSLIGILAATDTPAARKAIAAATRHPDPVVRIEALGHLEDASSEGLRAELRALLQHPEPQVRLAALRAMEEHKVKVAGPFLGLRIRSPEFTRLPAEEKRQALVTLFTLAQSRAEALTVEILEDTRLVTNADHEESRAIAAEVLGRLANSRRVAAALGEQASKRWKTTDRVRDASRRAQSLLQRRLAQGAGSKEEAS